MEEIVRLTRSETIGGRSFTDPARTAEDLASIHVMAARLRGLLRQALPAEARPLVVQMPEPDGRQHRVVLCDERRLRAAPEPSFVGFFATKRPGIDPSPLTLTDDELVRELPAHSGILSYGSLELADGNWGNLIVVDPPDAKEHWRTSAKHTWAARELAPRHYAVLRLHNGRFPGGILSGGDPVLDRTRYWDFQGPVAWQADRPLTSASE
jgi:hypothetical protein